jgi:hypothetical protein
MLRTLALTAALVTVSTVALAEEIGEVGRVFEVQINHSTSDAYLGVHGRAFIGNKQSQVEYRWGGAACGSRTLLEHHVGLLVRALESGLKVEPRFQMGQGGSRCVVGFSLLP